MNESNDACPVHDRLMAIFSTPRAGSTWLGTIAASHPDVAYRFEPFSRIAKMSAAHRQRVDRLVETGFDEAALEQLYALLLQAHPETDKPPMFPKRYATRAARGKGTLWPVARKLGWGAGIYRYLYTPLGRPRLLWKEVGRVPILESLAATTKIPLVYLVRHPCAVVSSLIEGQKNALMPAGRSNVLEQILNRHDGALAETYVSRLDQLSDAEKEALLWRVDVERAMAALADRPEALVVVYEELCTYPEQVTARIFEHLGLDVHEQVSTFVHQSVHPPAEGERRADGWANAYFTVYRDPIASRDKWKHKISSEDRAAVMGVVEASPAYAYGATRGMWD